MKRVVLGFLLGICFLFLTGMGSLSGPTKMTVPEPDQNYAATILDESGVAADVEMLSFGGHTAIVGRLGSARISVDFNRIDAIAFRKRDDGLIAQVTLTDNETLSMTVDNKALTCYARLPYGGYRIDLENVQSIDIKGLVDAELDLK